jgi:hypothetical protein
VRVLHFVLCPVNHLNLLSLVFAVSTELARTVYTVYLGFPYQIYKLYTVNV